MTTATDESAVPSGIEALKVFISYSRVDMAAADRMVADLERNGFAVTIDRRDLPYGEEWQTELASFIAASDTVVWLVSPASVKSKWVNWELGEVGRLSKRLLPVKVAETDPATLPEALGRIHLLPAEGVYEASRHEADLVRALNTDRAWLKRATSLGEDAREWLAANRDGAHLLRGRALAEAEAWSVRPPRDVPAPASEILELILASRRGQDRRRRMTVTGSIAAAVIALGLAATAVWFGLEARDQATEAERQRLVAEENEKRAGEQERIARERQAEAENQERIANERQVTAVLNETISLASLARVALAEGLHSHAVKLALAAWPRTGDPDRPMLRRTADTLSEVLPAQFGRISLADPAKAQGPVTVSPDGLKVATASGFNTVRLWDATTGAELHVLSGHTGSLTALVFSPDSRRLASASWDGTVRIWDVESGEQQLQLVVPTNLGGGVSAVAFSPDSRFLAAGSWDPSVRVYDLGADSPVMNLAGHTKPVTAVAFSTDGLSLASVSEDGTARIWNIGQAAQTAVLEGHGDALTSVAFSPDGTRLVTGSKDETVGIWDVATGNRSGEYKGHVGWVYAVAFSPDGELIASGGNDNTVRLWDAQTGKESQLFSEPSFGNVSSLSFSGDGSVLWSGHSNGTARAWQLTAAKALYAIEEGLEAILSVAFHPDGSRLAFVGDGLVKIVDFTTGDVSLELTGSDVSITSAAFSPDGKALAVGLFTDGSARLLDAGSGVQGRVFEHDGAVAAVAFSPEGQRLATGSWDHVARIWPIEGERPPLELRGHTSNVVSVAFTANGKYLATASHDRTAKLWNTETGQLVFTTPEHDAEATAVAFLHDETRLVTTSRDGTISIWDLAGKLKHSWKGHAFSAEAVAYSSRTGFLATAALDGSVRLWDPVSGVQISEIGAAGTIVGASRPMSSVAFSPDGTRLAAGVGAALSGTGAAYAWDISSIERGDVFQIACQRLGNNTSLADVQKRYGLGELKPICGENPPLPLDWSKLQ